MDDKYLTNYGDEIRTLGLDLSFTTNPFAHYYSLYNEAVFNIDPEKVFEYKKEPTELKEKLIKYFNYYFLSPKNIMFTSGIDHAFEIIAFQLLSHESLIACIVPCFSRFEIVIKHFNLGNVIHIRNLLNLDSEMDIDVAYLCTPNNPTTEEYDINLIKNILETNPQTIFVIDGAFTEFGKYDPTKLLTQYDNLIILRSFSKIFGLPGIRLGYIISTENHIRKISNNLSPFRVSTITYQIAERVLEIPNLIEKTLKFLSSEWRYIKNSCPFPVIRKTNVPFYILYPPINSTQFVNILVDNNISIINGKYFTCMHENVVRVRIGSPEINKKFLNVLNDILHEKNWKK